MQQVIDGWDSDGPCTALGQSRALDAAGAALVNGVAIHAEDFDDTLEGAPIRVGAMVIPALLAAAEHPGLSGERALVGIVAGMAAVCRLTSVAAGHNHRARRHTAGIISRQTDVPGNSVQVPLDFGGSRTTKKKN